jgi:RHS repeat-associated protein
VVEFEWQGLQLSGERSSRTPGRSVRYLYSEGSHEPLARVDSAYGRAEVLWYHTELNGLPERMTEADGETAWRGSFSTWGETRQESGMQGGRVPQNLRFQGQYLDRETGLHYNLFRYYDPAMGRYTQSDPVGLSGGINTYAYVPDPLGWVDPWGLSKCKPEVKEVDPRDIRFSQSSVNGAGDLTHSMKTKGWAGDPVDVVRMSDGKLTTIDNTRILAASRAGIKVQAQIHEGSASLPTEFVERFTTKKGVPSTWEEAVRLRIGKQASGYKNGYPNGSDIIGSLD